MQQTDFIQFQEKYFSKKKRNILTFIVSIFVIIIFLLQVFFFGFNKEFNKAKRIEFKEGESLSSLAENLKKEKIIFSKSLFLSAIIILGDETKVRSGMYNFKHDEGVFTTARRVLEGDFGLELMKITFPEGFTRTQISNRLSQILPNWNEEDFLTKTKDLEGYLFPDTYFFTYADTVDSVIEKLTKNFEEKTKEYRARVNEKEFKEKIILASIVEKEVRGLLDKQIVAGIFYNRLKIDMALQADSTLVYVTGKNSYTLTTEDLKSKNEYNSYVNKGLPPTAISNPGIDSIKAVFEPVKNDYLYFLTDKSGDVYYAKTFEEHKRNKANYLHAY